MIFKKLLPRWVLPGAKEFVEWVSNHFQLVILSDTFYEFAHPLMKQLGW